MLTFPCTIVHTSRTLLMFSTVLTWIVPNGTCSAKNVEGKLHEGILAGMFKNGEGQPAHVRNQRMCSPLLIRKTLFRSGGSVKG